MNTSPAHSKRKRDHDNKSIWHWCAILADGRASQGARAELAFMQTHVLSLNAFQFRRPGSRKQVEGKQEKTAKRQLIEKKKKTSM